MNHFLGAEQFDFEGANEMGLDDILNYDEWMNQDTLNFGDIGDLDLDVFMDTIIEPAAEPAYPDPDQVLINVGGPYWADPMPSDNLALGATQAPGPGAPISNGSQSQQEKSQLIGYSSRVKDCGDQLKTRNDEDKGKQDPSLLAEDSIKVSASYGDYDGIKGGEADGYQNNDYFKALSDSEANVDQTEAGASDAPMTPPAEAAQALDTFQTVSSWPYSNYMIFANYEETFGLRNDIVLGNNFTDHTFALDSEEEPESSQDAESADEAGPSTPIKSPPAGRGVKRDASAVPTPESEGKSLKRLKTNRIRSPTTADETRFHALATSPPTQDYSALFNSYEDMQHSLEITKRLYRSPANLCTTAATDATFPSTNASMIKYVRDVFNAIMDWNHYIEWMQTVPKAVKDARMAQLYPKIDAARAEARRRNGQKGQLVLTVDDLYPTADVKSQHLHDWMQQQVAVLGRPCNNYAAETLAWQLVHAAINAQQGMGQSVSWTASDGA